MDMIMDMIGSGAVGIAKLLMCLGAIVALWFWHNHQTKCDDHQLLRDQNEPFALSRFGLVAGEVFAMYPATKPLSDNGVMDLIATAAMIMWAMAVFAVMPMVGDRTVLAKIKNLSQLLAGNVAVGLVEGVFFAGFGIALAGVFEGDGLSALMAVITTVGFTLAVLALYVATYFIFSVRQTSLSKSLDAGTADGSMVSAALSAGSLLSTGIVLRAAVSGDFVSWGKSLGAFLLTAGATLIVTFVLGWLCQRVLIRCSDRDIEHDALVVPAFMSAGVMVLVALLSSSVIPSLV